MTADLLGGALLLGLGAATWVWFRRRARQAGSSLVPASVEEPEDPVRARLDAHVRAKRSRLLDFVAALGAGCALTGLLLFLGSLVTPQQQMQVGSVETTIRARPNTLPTSAAPDGSAAPIPQHQPEPNPVQQGATSRYLLPATLAFIAGGGLAMLVGALLLGFAPGRWAKSVGTGMVTLGLTANGYLVKEAKFGDLFKFDTHIDKAGIELDFRNRLAELTQFGPEQLRSFDDFESGRAEIRPHMGGALDAICARWQAQGGRDQRGVLLIIGSTDRARLTAATSRQYESNVGLARARAEEVKTRLMEQCGVPPSQLVTLVSGPRHTPAGATAVSTDDAAKDRSVAVWALWSVPLKK